MTIRGTIRRTALAAATAALLLTGPLAHAATLDTDVQLATSIPGTQVTAPGTTSFTIKVWATGLVPTNSTGSFSVTNQYSMATDGTITAGAGTTSLALVRGYNYSTQCPSTGAPLGCASNPFIVNATLAVASGTPGGTNGTLTVKTVGTNGVGADPTPDSGYVTVLANNTPPNLSVTGVTDGASYEIGSVPAATCSVTDAEDGASSFAATLSPITGPLAAYGIGTQTASCSYTDAGGITVSASATYSIVDTGNPTITFLSRTPANGFGWNNTDVVVTWSCSDSGTGVVDATVSQTVSTEGAGQSATGTCTDLAGNSTSDTVTGINIDKTAPFVSGSATPAPNANGWNNTAVVVHWTCTDPLSGVDTVSVDETLSSEGAAQSALGSCSDKAGNSASATVSGISIDLTAPSIIGSRAPAANVNGWNNTPVTVSWSCTDALSGVASVSADETLSTEGGGQSATGTCTDNADNTASATVSTINIDLTGPVVSIVGGPAAGASYYFGQVPAAPTCSASDALSGLAGPCAISGYGTTVGTHTITASATDLAGNTTTVTRTYTVLAWTLYGFYQPVDMNGVVNVVKAGSTVPFKFEVFAGSTELTDTAVVKSFTATPYVCSLTAPTDDIEITTTGGTSLRYDPIAGQFVENWQTPKAGVGSCYKVTMTTQDGSTLTALFKLR